ncbi:hypothetical protein ACA910_017786 [Epithemia clementina (nom. ined.)]
MIGGVSGVQTWAILKRHAQDEIGPLRLQELCRDNDRVSSLVAVHNSKSVAFSMTTTDQPATEQDRMLLLDLSRQRMTTNTLNHLLQLATARGLQKFIKQLSWGGHNDPNDPVKPLRLSSSNSGGGSLSNNPQHRRYTKIKNNHNAGGENTSKVNTAQKTARFEGDTDRNVFGQANPNVNHPQIPSQIDTSTMDQGKASTTAHKDSISLSSMHMALRVPKDEGYEMLLEDGTNALDGIHYEWNRLERLTNLIRCGSFRGITGNMIQTCLVVGSGVAVKALQFVYRALLQDERAVLQSRAGLEPSTNNSSANRLLSRPRNILLTAAAAATGNASHSSGLSYSSSSSLQSPCRRLVFLSTMDPVAAAQTLQDLDAATTLVVSIALRGNEETCMITSLIKQWILQELGGSSSSHGNNAGSNNAQSSAGTAPSTSGHHGNNNRRPDLILSKHMMLVTGNENIASAINKPESVHLIPQQCRAEAFTTFTAATLLPIGIVFGWSTAREFLAGAHDVDLHFVNTNPRHNLCILLALTDIWNDILLGNNTGRVITPFSQALAAYPSFCAALESQSCGNTSSSSMHEGPGSLGGTGGSGTSASLSTAQNYGSFMDRRNGKPNNNKMGCSSIVVDGGIAAAAYDRALYQSDAHMVNSELVMTLDPQLQFNALRRMNINTEKKPNSPLCEAIHAAQDTMICAMFAHADELAFGSIADTFQGHKSNLPPLGVVADPSSSYHGAPYATAATMEMERTSRGNRPSTLLLCNKLDAFSCGQLAALAEHRVAVKAHIWGHSFWHNELGSALRIPRTHQLKEGLTNIISAMAGHDGGGDDEDDDDLPGVGNTILSTRTILRHYGKLVKETRRTVPDNS